LVSSLSYTPYLFQLFSFSLRACRTYPPHLCLHPFLLPLQTPGVLVTLGTCIAYSTAQAGRDFLSCVSITVTFRGVVSPFNSSCACPESPPPPFPPFSLFVISARSFFPFFLISSSDTPFPSLLNASHALCLVYHLSLCRPRPFRFRKFQRKGCDTTLVFTSSSVLGLATPIWFEIMFAVLLSYLLLFFLIFSFSLIIPSPRRVSPPDISSKVFILFRHAPFLLFDLMSLSELS